MHILDSPLILYIGFLEGKRKPDEHKWWRSRTERLQDVHSCSPAKSYEDVTEISLIEERRPLIVEILRTRTGNDDPTFEFGSKRNLT